MTRIFTVTVRESIVNETGEVVGNTAKQHTVIAKDVFDAAKKVLATIEKEQPEHAKKFEVVAVVLTTEAA